MADFSPQELDQIEDLLEGLEEGIGLEDAQLSEAARERLDDYREVLALSREHLPLEEPEASVLAGVMAEARQTAFNATTTAAGVVVAPRQGDANIDGRGSWFKRWLPAMALAASAAAVLFWMRPDTPAGENTAASPLAKAESAAPAEVRESAPEGLDADKVAQAVVEESEAVDAEPSDDTPRVQDTVEEEPREAPAKKVRTGTKKSAAKPAQQEVDDALETPPAVDKDEAWGTLTRAHSLRRQGECHSARGLYTSLEHEGVKANIRAKALAGHGICDEFDGRISSAEARYSKARALQDDINGFIEAEREVMRANGHMPKKAKPSPKKKSRSKKSKKGK
jgi:hypothetical protein